LLRAPRSNHRIARCAASGAPSGKATYHTIKATAIKSLTVLTPAPANSRTSGSLPLPATPVQLAERGTARERAQIMKATDEAKFLRVGASQRAQYIFDALRKTMPCEWLDAESFNVLGEYTVKPPYSPESCEGPEGQALVRVRKVLYGVCERIGS